MEHGTDTGYTYHGCRCDLCRSAHAKAARKRRRANSGNGEKLREVAEHMQTMKREDLEAALLAYALYFLRIADATSDLMRAFPEENEDSGQKFVWGETQ